MVASPDAYIKYGNALFIIASGSRISKKYKTSRVHYLSPTFCEIMRWRKVLSHLNHPIKPRLQKPYTNRHKPDKKKLASVVTKLSQPIDLY